MIYNTVELYNVHELLDDEEDGGKIFSRIPEELRLKLNDSAKNNALQTPGGEVRFNLKGDSATITLRNNGVPSVPSVVEVYQGAILMAVHTLDTAPTAITVTQPGNMDLLTSVSRKHRLLYDVNLSRVVLPWRPPCRLMGIEGDTEPPRPEQTPATKYLAYGSSITHGSTSVRPTGSYAMRTAQLLGVDLINLGFGGGAHLEREMADYIAQRTDWDFASMEMGINLLGSIDTDEFARRVEYFIPTIAQAHPDQWIFCIDVFPCRWDFAGDDKAQRFRDIVRAQVDALNMPKLAHVSGKDILTSITGLTVDLVHPSPSGMEEMARNLANAMRERVG